MAGTDPKADFHRYLQDARDALLWKLDGLGEYDVRRPLVPTGTSLLGLVKHVAGIELGYFGDTFGRAHGEPLPEFDPDEPLADPDKLAVLVVGNGPEIKPGLEELKLGPVQNVDITIPQPAKS